MTASPLTSCASARMSQVSAGFRGSGSMPLAHEGQQAQPGLVALTLAKCLDQPEQVLFDRVPVIPRGKPDKLGQPHPDELEILARRIEVRTRYGRHGFLEFPLADQDGKPHVQDLSFRRRRVGSRSHVELRGRLVQPSAPEEQVGLEQAGESPQTWFGHRFPQERQGVGFAGSTAQ